MSLPLTPYPLSLKKILVIKPKPLGDVMMATPVVRSLRRHWPNTHIAFLTEPPYTELLEGNPAVDEIIPFDRARTGTLAFCRLLRSKRFDAVLDLWCTSRTVGWTLASGAPHRIGFNHRFRRWAYTTRVHSHASYAGDINLDCVRAMGVEETNSKPEMFLKEEEKTFARKFLNDHKLKGALPLIMVAPGAGWPSKRWPVESFAGLVDRLMTGGKAQVLVLSGPQDEDEVHELANRLRTRPVIVYGTTLRQTAALVQAMKLYIGNDSGPMHFAVAFDVPTITLMGPNNSDFISPSGPHLEMRHDVPCAPCNQRECPLGHHHCLTLISVDEVMRKVEQVL